MAKLLFILRCVIKKMAANKLITAIIILSLIFGLLYSAFILCYGNNIIDDIKADRMKDYELLIRMYPDMYMPAEMYMYPEIYDGYAETIGQNDIVQIISENDWIDKVYTITDDFAKIMLINGRYIFGGRICLVDYNYYELYDNMLDDGSWFSKSAYKNGVKECIIGEQLAEKYFDDNPLGKTIKINNDKYIIAGVSGKSDLRYKVCVPVDSLSPGSTATVTYYIKSKNSSIYENINTLTEYITDNFGWYQIIAEKEYYENQISQTMKIIITVLLISFIVLVYAILNIYNIILYRINESKKEFGIKIAFGAKKADIYLQHLLELIIFTFTSSIIVFLIFCIGRSFISSALISIKPDMGVLLMMIMICSIVSILLNYVLLRRTLKLQIAELLR